jgi:spoIIIJ-associated protein
MTLNPTDQPMPDEGETTDAAAVAAETAAAEGIAAPEAAIEDATGQLPLEAADDARDDTEGEAERDDVTEGGSAGDAEAAAEDESAQRRGESTEERLARLEEEGDIAADFLEELLDIADLDGDIDIDVDGDRASVEIRGADQLARMNGLKGELLDALQELARLAVQTRTGSRSRLMLDIGGFRAEHKSSLEVLAEEAVAQAKEEGAPVPLRPMNPFERKVVHDVAKREGLRSESDGDGKDRHVVIYPTD